LLHAASTHATALLHAATSAAHAAAALHAALHAAASHWATAPNASTLRQRAADEESRSQGVDDSHSSVVVTVLDVESKRACLLEMFACRGQII
jgi:hypothetical protein